MASDTVYSSLGATIELGEIESLAKGTIIVGDGTGAPASLAAGTNTHALIADSAQTVGLKWASVDAGDGHITIMPQSYDSIVTGGAEVLRFQSGSPSDLFPFLARIGADSTTTTVRWKAFLAAGTYTFYIICRKDTNGDTTADIEIDSVNAGSFSSYNASILYNQFLTIASIVVATSGLKNIDLLLASGKYVYIDVMGFYRTA